MDLYVYSDESGVFDVMHNNYYVFGGLIIIGDAERNACINKYLAKEKQIKSHYPGKELKATIVSNGDKLKLFKILNHFYKFGVIINENSVHQRIFESKKSKQRFLDYIYKVSLKRALESLMDEGIFKAEDIQNIHIYTDEHTTATDGKYELRESIEQEFKIGIFNTTWDIWFPPIFPKLASVTLNYCDSKVVPLIRSADIIANRLYYYAQRNLIQDLESITNMCVIDSKCNYLTRYSASDNSQHSGNK